MLLFEPQTKQQQASGYPGIMGNSACAHKHQHPQQQDDEDGGGGGVAAKQVRDGVNQSFIYLLILLCLARKSKMGKRPRGCVGG